MFTTETQRHESKHHSLDAVLQHGDVEIDQEPSASVAEPQVGQQLGFVNWKQRFDGFEFDHDLLLDPPGQYKESVAVEHYSLPDSPGVEVVVPPGQKHRRAATWNDPSNGPKRFLPNTAFLFPMPYLTRRGRPVMVGTV